MSGQVSYDVYVKKGVDQMGREEFGEAVAHFVERSNAVALKRRLVARGKLKKLATVLAVAVALCCSPVMLIAVLYSGLILSVEVPSRFVDSGVQGFEGVKKEQARRFMSETHYLLTEISVMPKGALRVESVKKCPPDAKPGDLIDGPTPGRVRLPYSAEVREYGPFGIPREPIKWHCDGTASWGDRVMIQ